MKNPTTWLDVVGAVALSVFAFIVWPALALLAIGIFALLASRQLSRRLPR